MNSRVVNKFAIGAALSSVLVMAPSAVASSAPAQAAGVQQRACNNDFQSGPNNSSATLQAMASSPYRKGPGANYCSFGNHEGLAYIHCRKQSDAGNPWYLARDSNSGTVGWIWAGNVSSTSGTIKNCGA